ncbi:MAG: FtsX-like permease family protein [Methylococcales bacterium]
MFGLSKLAVRNYFHDWQSSFCLVLALAAVLGPMLIVFGIKHGIVSGMINELVEEPRNRELRAVYSGQFDTDWITELRQQPSVSFLVPRTRNIAATIDLKSKTARRILHTELIPTATADPLLPSTNIPLRGYHWLILSESAARKLAVQAGDTVDASISRRYQEQTQREHLIVQIADIAPINAFERDGAFASIELLEALEAYRDGHTVPDLGWPGESSDSSITYAGFRLFVRSIHDVAELKNWLNQQGVEVSTRAHEIATVQRMKTNLSTIYWAIAVIGLIGFSLALGASLWVDIDRKHKELSVLRLVGYTTADIIYFPMIQGLLTAVFGWLLAIIIFHGVASVINNMMLSQLEVGRQVCYMLPQHYVLSLLLTCASALLVAMFAGLRSATIEPAEGLRDR